MKGLGFRFLGVKRLWSRGFSVRGFRAKCRNNRALGTESASVLCLRPEV